METEKMEDIDAMFSDLLGEMDNLSQSLVDTAQAHPAPKRQSSFIGFSDLNESLNELEEQDLDALVADLRSVPSPVLTDPQSCSQTDADPAAPAMTQQAEPAANRLTADTARSSGGLQSEPRTKADKIKLALENLNESKVIVKVLMCDGGSKTLMVDEREKVREVLDKLFEKTHCDCSVDWSLCETNQELQSERGFEDHEYLVESVSSWTPGSENQIYFVSRPQKYVMFKDPQIFYMWKKKAATLSGTNEQAKQLLLQENFGGSTVIVPDLEGTLLLKEDGKKVWRPRYFVLRASGLYYVPKGKTKSSSDLASFVNFEKVDVYTTNNYKTKYRAPTSFCFMLKHPCIQKESQYVKFLCCEDEQALLLWVNSIRIAKYGTILYKNFQTAMKRTVPSFRPSSLLLHTKINPTVTLRNSHTSPRRPSPTPPPPAELEPAHTAV